MQSSFCQPNYRVSQKTAPLKFELIGPNFAIKLKELLLNPELHVHEGKSSGHTFLVAFMELRYSSLLFFSHNKFEVDYLIFNVKINFNPKQKLNISAPVWPPE